MTRRRFPTMAPKRLLSSQLGILLSGALIGCAALSQETPLARAQALIQAGHAVEAYPILAEAEPEQAGNPEFDLALAVAANEAGMFPRAIMALERVLVAEPDNRRARAEMGRALLGVGDRKGARALLSESRERGLEAVAGENIEQLLHAIDRVEAEGKSSARGYAELSAGADSNINSAPGVSLIAVPAYGGSILPIDPAGARQRGGFAGYAAGFSGRLVLAPRWSVIGTATARGQAFGGARTNLNNLEMTANAGISYRLDRVEYTLVAQAGTYSIAHERVRNQWGGAGEWTYRLDGFRQFNAYLQAGRLAYPQQRIADTTRIVLGATYAHQSRSGVWSYGGVYQGRETPFEGSVPHLGHRVAGIRGGVQFPITENLRVFFAAGWEQRRYGGTDPLFLVARTDRQANAGAGVNWVPAPLWRVTPQWSLVRTQSNVVLAAYSKSTLSVAVRRDF